MVQDPANSGTFVDKTYLLYPPTSQPFLEVDGSEWSVRRFGPFSTAQVPVTSHYMENSEDIFHLGIVNGNRTSGCFYGYFSDYDEFDPGTFVVETGAPGGKICWGDSRQLYASGGTKYKWVPNDFLDFDDIATPLASTITNSIEYTVTVSGACDNSADRQVQIKVGGPVYCDFESDITEGCATKAAPADDPKLTVNFTNLSTGDVYRYWYYKLGETGTNTLFAQRDLDTDPVDLANNVSFDFPNTTADTVRYYVTLLTCDALRNCFQEVTKSILVYPFIDVNPSRTLLDALGCHPLGVNFVANPVGNSGGAKFNWEFDDGGSSNLETPSHTFTNFSSSAVNLSPSVTITDKYNYCTVTKNVSVTVQPYIKASFVINQPEGCSPLTVNITNNSVGGISANGYDWDKDGVAGYEITGVGATNWPSQSYTGNTNTTQRIIPVTLRVRNDGGCTDVFSRNITVNPRAANNTPIDSIINSDPRCSPLDISFTSNTSNATIFNWAVNDVGIANTANSSYVFENYGAGVLNPKVTFDATNQWGCAAPQQSLIVTVNPFVDAIIALNTREGCSPLDVEFTNASSLGSTDIEWLINGNPVTDPNSQSPFSNLTTANQVRKILVTLTAENGAHCRDVDTTSIRVNPQAIANFRDTLKDVHGNLLDPSGPLCSPVYASFYQETTNATRFYWTFGDQGTLNEANPQFVLRNLTDAPKPVEVTLISDNSFSCPDTAIKTYVIRPEIRANFNLSNSIGCPPLTFIVEAPPTSGTYNWDYSGMPGVYTNNSYAFTIDENRTGATQYYNISLSATDNDGICRAYSDTSVITVYPEVEAKWNLADAIDPSCSPYNFSIENQSTLYNSPTVLTDILWEIYDGEGYNTSSTGTTISRELINGDYVNPKDFTIDLIATSSNGCFDTKTATITVWPQVQAVFTADYLEFCTPVRLSLTNESQTGTGSTYTWDFDGGTQTSLGGENYEVTYVNNTLNDEIPVVIALDVENQYGCSDQYEFPFSVLPAVDANFALANGSVRYHCGNGGVTFDNLSTGGTLNYYWEFGDEQHFATPTNESVTHEYDNSDVVDTDYTVILTAKNIYDCDDTYETPITVHPRVVSNFSYTIPDKCAYPLQVDFVNASQYSTAQAGVETSFHWDYDFTWQGTVQEDDFNTTQPHSYNFYNSNSNDIAIYNVKLTASQFHENSGLTCPDTTSRPLSVYPRLVADFSSTARGCNPLTVTIRNSSLGVVTGDYLWDFGDNSTSNLQTPLPRVFAHTNKNASEFYTINLTVTNPLGCQQQTSREVEVYPLVVSEFVMDEGIAGCTPLTVNALNSSTSTQYNYQWIYGDGRDTTYAENPGSIGDITYTNSTTNTPVIQNYELKLKTTYVNDASCIDSTSKIVTVYPHVYPYFSSDFEGCHPHDVTFQNLTDVFSSNTEYRWDFSNGTTSSQAEPQNVRFVNTSLTDIAQYTVRLDATSEHGCTDYFDTIVTVYPRPKSKMEIIGEYVSCPPFNVDLQNQSVGTNLTYLYNFGDGTDSTTTSDDNMTHIFNNFGEEIESFMVTLTAETEYGCSDISSQTLFVFPGVQVAFEFLPDAGCNPHTPEIQNNTLGPAFYYNWDFDDNGITSYLQEPTYRFVNTTEEDKVFLVSLTASTVYDCEDVDTVPLTVYAAPITEFSIDPPLHKFPEATFTFENQTSPAADDWTYTWDFNDGYGSDLKHPGTHTYETWGPRENNFNYDVTLHVTNGNCEDTKTRQLTLLPPLPISGYSVNGDSASCSPLEVYFINESFYDFGDSCQWDFDDGTFSNQCNEVYHVFTEPGFYNVRLTVYGDGGANYSYKTFTVYRNPVADFEVVPEQVMLPEATIRLFNLTQFGYNYEWDFGDGTPTDTLVNPLHTYDEMGEYRISLTARTKEGCIDVASKFPAVWVLGPGEIKFPNAFVPNPGGPSGGYYDDVDYKNEVFHPYAEGVMEYKLYIFNRWGEQLFTSDDIKIGWDGYYNEKLCPQDVYVWRAIGSFANGKQFDLRGNVTLLR